MIKMITKKYIAFLDVLGFKDLVKNNPHEKLATIYERLFSSAVTVGLSKGNRIFFEKDGKSFWEPKFSDITVNSLIVSDSIIVWTDDVSPESFLQIIVSIKTLMRQAFFIGFPLRGAIVKGDLSVFKSSYKTSNDNSLNTLVGLGLVNAYRIEEEQDWSGCILDDSCVLMEGGDIDNTHLPSIPSNMFEYLITNEYITKYKIPFKSGSIKEKYAINWITKKSGDSLLTKTSIRQKFSEYNKNIDDWKVERIIRNTIDCLSPLIVGHFS